MAGKNQVTLTFAGNAKPLKESTAEVDDALKRVSDASDDAGDRLSRMQRLAGDGAKDVDRYSTNMDGLAESADGAETRMTGLASGIDGVTTLMDDPSPQEFAQGLADMADGAGNFLVPTLKKAGAGIRDFMIETTGAKTGLGAFGRTAVVAAGAAGLGALIYSIDQADRKAREADFDRLTKQFEGMGEVDFSAVELMRGDIEKLFDTQLAKSPEAGRAFVEWAASAGFSREKTAEWAAEVRTASDTQDLLNEEMGITNGTINAQAEAIQRVREQNMALFDPIFAAVNANRTLAEAQQAVVLAVDEHGRASQEYRDAQWSAIEATVGQDSAIRQLAESVTSGDTPMFTAVRRLEELTAGSGNSAAMVTILKEEVRRLSEQVGGIPGYRRVDIDVNINRRLTGFSGQFREDELLSGYGRATGGGVPGGWVGEVGEQGREIMAVARGYTGHVWTPSQFGSFMKAAPDAAALDMMQGGQTVHVDARQTNVNVAGSLLTERKLVAVVRAELDRGGLR